MNNPAPPTAPGPEAEVEVETLREALDHVRRFATLNFIGGAFDPEHMRAIANYCTGVLNGESPLPSDLSDAPEAFFLEALRENGWTVTRTDEPETAEGGQ